MLYVKKWLNWRIICALVNTPAFWQAVPRSQFPELDRLPRIQIDMNTL